MRPISIFTRTPFGRIPGPRTFGLDFPRGICRREAAVEPVFMASRDGLTFTRYPEPVIPRTAPKDRDGNRSNYMANGLLQLPGKEGEYSVYGTEAYYTGPDSRLRRFVYRVDGFVSLQAGGKGGEATTKTLQFQGNQLKLNFQTSKGGELRVEIQDPSGTPIQGFALADCQALTGDHIEQQVAWKNGDLAKLAGRPVRLRFVVNSGDLYSYQFRTRN